MHRALIVSTTVAALVLGVGALPAQAVDRGAGLTPLVGPRTLLIRTVWHGTNADVGAVMVKRPGETGGHCVTLRQRADERPYAYGLVTVQTDGPYDVFSYTAQTDCRFRWAAVLSKGRVTAERQWTWQVYADRAPTFVH